MKDLTTLLRDGDPMRLEPALSMESRDAMRRAIVTAAEAAAPQASRWRQSVALAAMTLLTVAGAAAAHRFAEDRGAADPPVPDASPAQAPRQVHFKTPGGTRIIWTIDPAFQLAGTGR